MRQEGGERELWTSASDVGVSRELQLYHASVTVKEQHQFERYGTCAASGLPLNDEAGTLGDGNRAVLSSAQPARKAKHDILLRQQAHLNCRRTLEHLPLGIPPRREGDLLALPLPRSLGDDMRDLSPLPVSCESDAARARLTRYLLPSWKYPGPSASASQTVSWAVRFVGLSSSLASRMRMTRKPRTSRTG